MSVIKERQWATTDGTIKSAWVVIYTDGSGKRRLKTFTKNKAASISKSTRTSGEGRNACGGIGVCNGVRSRAGMGRGG